MLFAREIGLCCVYFLLKVVALSDKCIYQDEKF